MKKVLLFGGIITCLTITACNNDKAPSSTHTHEDGSTHNDHAHDTVKPAQQEFTVGDSAHSDTDTSKAHTHHDGETHTH